MYIYVHIYIYQPNSLCANPFYTSDKNCVYVLLKMVNIFEAIKIITFYFISSGL